MPKARSITASAFSGPGSGEAVTGLTFPSNGSPSVRFHFNTPPSIQPLTLLWKIFPIQQTGYYSTFFWGLENGTVAFDITQGGHYIGCHPYPQGIPPSSGTVHNWEIASQQQDIINDANGNSTVVTKGQWYSQACLAEAAAGNQLRVRFFWDLVTGLTRVIDWTSDAAGGYLLDPPPSGPPDDPGLFFGDAAWSPTNEMMSGHFRGLIIVASALSTAHIAALRAFDANADALSYCAANSITLWYLNLSPTPTDISDKSGAGNNPVWANANRPTLWTP